MCSRFYTKSCLRAIGLFLLMPKRTPFQAPVLIAQFNRMIPAIQTFELDSSSVWVYQSRQLLPLIATIATINNEGEAWNNAVVSPFLRRCFTKTTPLFSPPCAMIAFRLLAPNSLFARDLSHLSHYLSHGNAVNVIQLHRSVIDWQIKTRKTLCSI